MCGYPTEAPYNLGAAGEKSIARAMEHAGATIETQNAALISEDARAAILTKFEDYIWRDRDGSGICSACKETVDAREIHAPHKGWMHCPECGKTVQVRDFGELAVLAIVIALRALLSLLIHFEMKHH